MDVNESETAENGLILRVLPWKNKIDEVAAQGSKDIDSQFWQKVRAV